VLALHFTTKAPAPAALASKARAPEAPAEAPATTVHVAKARLAEAPAVIALIVRPVRATMVARIARAAIVPIDHLAPVARAISVAQIAHQNGIQVARAATAHLAAADPMVTAALTAIVPIARRDQAVHAVATVLGPVAHTTRRVRMAHAAGVQTAPRAPVRHAALSVPTDQAAILAALRAPEVRAVRPDPAREEMRHAENPRANRSAQIGPVVIAVREGRGNRAQKSLNHRDAELIQSMR
jgi:hypothetical protein